MALDEYDLDLIICANIRAKRIIEDPLPVSETGIKADCSFVGSVLAPDLSSDIKSESKTLDMRPEWPTNS